MEHVPEHLPGRNALCLSTTGAILVDGVVGYGVEDLIAVRFVVVQQWSLFGRMEFYIGLSQTAVYSSGCKQQALKILGPVPSETLLNWKIANLVDHAVGSGHEIRYNYHRISPKTIFRMIREIY